MSYKNCRALEEWWVNPSRLGPVEIISGPIAMADSGMPADIRLGNNVLDSEEGLVIGIEYPNDLIANSALLLGHTWLNCRLSVKRLMFKRDMKSLLAFECLIDNIN